MTVFVSRPKSVAETISLVADYVGRLDSGATIASCTVSQSVYSGATSTVSLGSASISGARATAQVAGGTAGTIYQITFLATLSTGQVLSLETLLAVVPNAI